VSWPSRLLYSKVVRFRLRCAVRCATSDTNGPLLVYDALLVAVLGCRKFVAPVGSSVVEEGNTATVRCNGSKETWYFTCSETRWRGQVVNCSNKGAFALRNIAVTNLIIIIIIFVYNEVVKRNRQHTIHVQKIDVGIYMDIHTIHTN